MDGDEILADIRGHIARDIAGGFRDRDAIIEGTTEVFADNLAEDVVARVVPALYDEALAEYHEAQKAWPAVTDCDRLDAAFDALNVRGIMARHDWWCCQTCGHGAMPEESDRLAAAAPDLEVRGYAFYHNQDTESVVDDGSLRLAYGATEPGAEPAEAIGREIVAVLREHGLAPRWDGTVATRIAVKLIWQRRARPARWCQT